jgi:urease accessory protein
MRTGALVMAPDTTSRLPGSNSDVPATARNPGALTEHALFQLLAWSSPGYPTGAFSYSHGLEWAVEAGDVTNLQTLLAYVTAVVSRGGGWIDVVLFAHTWRAVSDMARLDEPGRTGASSTPSAEIRRQADAQLDALSELASAFRGSAETALESRQQGAAFLDVTRKAWPHPTLDAFAQRHKSVPIAHCVAVAIACAAHGVALTPSLHSYLHAVAANLVSAGARLIPLGQTQAQIAIARLSATLAEVVERALTTSLDDLGTSAPSIEVCSLRHETQYTRLFRS